MKRIVFVTQWWPLHNSANVLCDYKIINQLLKKRKDLEIHVVCYQAPGEPKEELVEGVHTHRIRLDLSTYLFLKAKNMQVTFVRKIFRVQWGLITRIKQIVFLPFFPHFHPLLENRLLKALINNNKKHPFDLVFADHAGFDTLISGFKFSKKTKILFFPLFWDSLSCGRPVRYLPFRWQSKRKFKIEKKIVGQCQRAFVLETNQFKIQKLYNNNPIELSKFCFIGVPYLSSSPFYSKKYSNKQNDFVDIVFGGSLHGRDVNPFLQAIKYLSKELSIVVTFYTSETFHRRLHRHVSKNGVKEFVNIKSNISHKDFVSRIKEADILLNFGNNTIEALPSKLLEYISILKPIITTNVKDDDASSQIIKKYKAGFVFQNRNFDNIEHLEDLKRFILTSKELERQIDYDEVKKIYKKYTTEEVTNTVEMFSDL